MLSISIPDHPNITSEVRRYIQDTQHEPFIAWATDATHPEYDLRVAQLHRLAHWWVTGERPEPPEPRPAVELHHMENLQAQAYHCPYGDVPADVPGCRCWERYCHWQQKVMSRNDCVACCSQ